MEVPTDPTQGTVAVKCRVRSAPKTNGNTNSLLMIELALRGQIRVVSFHATNLSECSFVRLDVDFGAELKQESYENATMVHRSGDVDNGSTTIWPTQKDSGQGALV